MKFSFSNLHLLTQESIKDIYQPVSQFAHKGSTGSGILIAGSRNMPGAAILSAKAALRSGMGKLMVHAPATVLEKVALSIPEALLDYDPNPDCFSLIPDYMCTCKALAIGPGLGQNPATVNVIPELLKNSPYPVIMDADALNILADNRRWLNFLPVNSIITPHAKEFDNLVIKSENRMERIVKAQNFAQKYHIIVILKGHYSTIVTPNRNIFVNTTGNQGMATAGSGDVLTGIVLGLLTKGYSPENAAKLGVYIHGLAGDCALEKQSHETLIASDIIENLGRAFKMVM